jgi:hypothetical protein
MDKQTFITTFQTAFVNYCEDWAEADYEDKEDAGEFARNIIVELAKDEELRAKLVKKAAELRAEGYNHPESDALLRTVDLRSKYFRMNHSVVVDIPEDDYDREITVTLLCELLRHGMELWTPNYGLSDATPWSATTVSLGEIEFDDVPDFGPYAIDLSDGIPEAAVKTLRWTVEVGILAHCELDNRSTHDRLLLELIALRKMVGRKDFAKQRKLHNDDFEGTVYAITQLTKFPELVNLDKVARALDLWHTWFVYMDPANQ